MTKNQAFKGRELWVYVIDKNDKFVEISDNWKEFASENYGLNIRNPKDVIGHSLYEFIAGKETKYLYRLILDNVRSKQKTVSFSFRCDAPDLRRFLTMTVHPMEEGGVRFLSNLDRVEPREPVDLLKSSIKRSAEMVRMCSMCKKVALPGEKWVEVEEAVQELKLFDNQLMPQITHGLCPECYQNILNELRK